MSNTCGMQGLGEKQEKKHLPFGWLPAREKGATWYQASNEAGLAGSERPMGCIHLLLGLSDVPGRVLAKNA